MLPGERTRFVLTLLVVSVANVTAVVLSPTVPSQVVFLTCRQGSVNLDRLFYVKISN